jgi:hypothetical protein
MDSPRFNISPSEVQLSGMDYSQFLADYKLRKPNNYWGSSTTISTVGPNETLGAEIEQLEKPPKLSEAALKAVTNDAPKSQAPSQKGKKKPAWAVTEKQSEDNKEAEID